MRTKLNKLINNFNVKVAEKNILENNLSSFKSRLDREIKYCENLIKARWVVTEVTKRTQDNIKKKIEKLVTMAIRSVFDRDFSFELIFEEKRNTIECTPIIKEGDNIYDDIDDDMGGGMIPIISFSLRVVFWSIVKPKLRPTIILDEPIKGSLGGDLLNKTIKMFHEVSNKLGLQLILITHYTELSDIADNVFHVSYQDGKSFVQKVK